MYRGRLERDLALWAEKGLIARTQADALLHEFDGRESSFTVGKVLLIIAAVLLSAALLLLVAANWEAVPRLLRVVGMIGLIWVFHLGAAFCLARQMRGLAAALLVLGTLSFGGAISLVGQMYHMSGDSQTVAFLWFAMACLSAVLFRSGAVTVIAGFLSWFSFGLHLELFDSRWEGAVGFAPPLMAIVIIALVYYTGAPRARHLAYLLLMAWLTWLYFIYDTPETAFALAGIGAAGFFAVAAPMSPLHGFARRAGAAPAFYSFLLVMIGLALLHISFDTLSGNLFVGCAVLFFSVVGIALCGRDNGAVRYLGYIAFAFETLYLSFVTVGTILGTSGLFLLSGLLVALVAWVVIRLEKRLARTSAMEVRP